MHRVRASRSLGRALRICAAVAVVVACFIAATPAGTSDYQQLFLATFTGQSDGPLSGTSVPVEQGHLNVVTSSGSQTSVVAPKTGILAERLVVSDVGSSGSNAIDVQLQPTGDAANGALISLAIRQEADCSAFGGDVSDGSTTDMLCFEVSSGSLTVNSVPMATKIKTGTNYRFDMNFASVSSGADYWEIWVTNVDTGDVEYATGLIDGGYRPVHAVGLEKHAGKPGAFSVDNLSILGLQH